MEYLGVVIVSAIIYILLCKVVYNGVLADPKEQLGDPTIFKTLMIALVAAGLAKYVMDKYMAVKLPWQEASISMSTSVGAPSAPIGLQPVLASHKLSTLVPQ